MNSSIQIGSFKRKVVRGVFVLGIRRVLYQLILTSSNILLARILLPDVFGSFAIVSFLILNLGILTNGGLAQALIQKKEDVSIEDIKTVLTSVIVTSVIFIMGIYMIAPILNMVYQGKIGLEGIYWLRVYSVYILLANIYALFMALIERKLEYTKMTIGELSTLFFTQGITVVLAFSGWGIGSFVIGSLIGISVGICILYTLNPLPLGILFSQSALRRLLRFGFHYQQGTFISAINSAVTPGYVGIVSGPTAVGYITVVSGMRQTGLAPTEILSRLLFASSSHMQQNKQLLKSLVEKMIRLCSMTSLPLLGILFALAPEVLSLVLSPRWLPALLTLYLSIFQGILLILSTIFMQVLLGLGYAQFVRNTLLIWTIVQWVLTPILVWVFGYNGVVVAGILVSTLFFIPLKKLREDIDIQIWPFFAPYIVYSVFLAGITYVFSQLFIIDSLLKLIAVGGIAIIFYSAILILVERQQLMSDTEMIKKLLLSKNV